MKIIPVIDLLNGAAVYAQRGRREHYRPLNTPLCGESCPFAVLDAYLSLCDFDEFYLADLDALTGRSDQSGLIREICRAHPGKTFWVDRGFPVGTRYDGAPRNLLNVIGSESLSEECLLRLEHPASDFVLSLDIHPDRPLGPSALFDDPRYWPERVILMTLERVGSDLGPDFERLAAYRSRWPANRFVAAGGIRGEQDIIRLEDLGIYAVLVASALHFGKIGANFLARRAK